MKRVESSSLLKFIEDIGGVPESAFTISLMGVEDDAFCFAFNGLEVCIIHSSALMRSSLLPDGDSGKIESKVEDFASAVDELPFENDGDLKLLLIMPYGVVSIIIGSNLRGPEVWYEDSMIGDRYISMASEMMAEFLSVSKGPGEL